MAKPLVVTFALLTLGAGIASANPLGSLGDLGEVRRPGQESEQQPTQTDCEALKRNPELRTRLRPSERRERITQCERRGLLARGETPPVAAPPR